jgi:hypothetical protein
MCYEDLQVIRGRARGRLATLAACLAVVPGLAACGADEDEPSQTAAPAVTGADDETSKGTDTTAQIEGEDREAVAGSEPSGEPLDDDAEITQTLQAVLAGSDPRAACGERVTDRFLRRSYGDAAGCEAALKGAAPAKDAGVTQVVVHPDSVAQALARPAGGIYDGQKLRAELVLDDGTWKLDSLRSNVPVGP